MKVICRNPDCRHEFLAHRACFMSSFLARDLGNLWLGVSVEDQATADVRIPRLLEIPAKVRFLSVEPMLGPVDVGLQSATCKCCPRWPSRWVRLNRTVRADWPLTKEKADMCAPPGIYLAHSNQHGALAVNTPGGLLGIKPDEFECLPGLDWVICGGESGPGARPLNPEWVRSLCDQCVTAGVPFFFKQWGGNKKIDGHWGGNVLDGKVWNQTPKEAHHG